MHDVVVVIQRERVTACWALAGHRGPHQGGVSCWEQLRPHAELTDERVAEAWRLLGGDVAPLCVGHAASALSEAVSDLGRARAVVQDAALGVGSPPISPPSSDRVSAAYSHACRILAEVVAKALEEVRPADPHARRAARRFRLLSAAVEQLGRERAFVCGGRRRNPPLEAESAAQVQCMPGEKEKENPPGSAHCVAELPQMRPCRPKVLLGEVHAEMDEIHGRLATGLIDAMRRPEESLSLPSRERRQPRAAPGGCCDCRAGLKMLLRAAADML